MQMFATLCFTVYVNEQKLLSGNEKSVPVKMSCDRCGCKTMRLCLCGAVFNFSLQYVLDFELVQGIVSV